MDVDIKPEGHEESPQYSRAREGIAISAGTVCVLL